MQHYVHLVFLWSAVCELASKWCGPHRGILADYILHKMVVRPQLRFVGQKKTVSMMMRSCLSTLDVFVEMLCFGDSAATSTAIL